MNGILEIKHEDAIVLTGYIWANCEVTRFGVAVQPPLRMEPFIDSDLEDC
jgi:hypothetical protein